MNFPPISFKKSMIVIATGFLYQIYLVIRLLTELIIGLRYNTEDVVSEAEKYYKFNGFQIEIGMLVLFIYYGYEIYQKLENRENNVELTNSKKHKKSQKFVKKQSKNQMILSLIIFFLIFGGITYMFAKTFGDFFGIFSFFKDVNKMMISDKSLLIPGLIFTIATAIQFYFERQETVQLFLVRIRMFFGNYKILFILTIVCTILSAIFASSDMRIGSVLAFNLYLLYNEIKIYKRLQSNSLEVNKNEV